MLNSILVLAQRVVEFNDPIDWCFFNYFDKLFSLILKHYHFLISLHLICLIILKVSGDIFEELSSRDQNSCCSVLFYATWCPFSHKTRPTFDALSSMFPQIKHLLVEDSSVDPRYVVARLIWLTISIKMSVQPL